MLLETATFLEDLRFHFLSKDPVKIARYVTFWKVPRQTNAYVSNKWPLKLPCAYLNTQGSNPSDTPLKRIDNG
ncbi:hypothetical protein T02_15612 [Trichinella nativa]|uniref:Uncharacterized protein n=1 Tax=Trichinella nativa TaxID=6335 RepID=A0A0V1LJR5_9BILA|nr:hypothetical protein T02_15612 [Trichinella nativa]